MAGTGDSKDGRRPLRVKRRRRRQPRHSGVQGIASIASNRTFQALGIFLICILAFQLIIVCFHDEIVRFSKKNKHLMEPRKAFSDFPDLNDQRRQQIVADAASNDQPAHLFPHLAPLPIFAPIENGKDLETATLNGKPTIAGIASILSSFLQELHAGQKKWAADNAEPLRDHVIQGYVDLAEKWLLPLDDAYRGKSIFPVRDDDSIYVSVAAFRDYLLGETLKTMFRQAANPDKVFIGVIVQNCFGIDTTCKTGLEVVGKNSEGRDMTKVSDAPPDKNGVAEFCEDEEFKKYCASGQIRALYVHEAEAIGPAAARYFASKLWGGETYYIQIDAHLHFAKEWDAKFIQELQAAKSYPKAVLSSYPPGFETGDSWEETKGAKLCNCVFSTNEIEEHIIRINAAGSYRDYPPAPTQIPFIAAGFFFTRAEFIVDVPFDPMLPWVFMGEEISLSMRAWTSGWDIYAPRKNLIAHQYRPGRMGLPKFWESVGRVYQRGGGFFHRIQQRVIQRVKHMVGYPEASREILQADKNIRVLKAIEHYGLGNVRSHQAYLDLTRIDITKKQCLPVQWCMSGKLD